LILVKFNVLNSSRLDVAVAKELQISRNQALNLIKDSLVSVNLKPVSKPSFLLSENDEICVNFAPKKEVQKRIALRGREQDSPEIFEERWKIYQDNRGKIIAPLLGSGVGFLVLDGVGTPEEVYERALSMMKNDVIKK